MALVPQVHSLASSGCSQVPSFEGFVWDGKGWEGIPVVAAQGCDLPVPALRLGKVGIPQETLPCRPLVVFGVEKNYSGSFMRFCLGVFFCSALSAPSLGRAQLCPAVPRLVERVLQQHLGAGLEPQAGSELLCVGAAVPARSTVRDAGELVQGGRFQIISDFSTAGMGNDPTFPSLCQRPEIPVLFLLFLPFQELGTRGSACTHN